MDAKHHAYYFYMCACFSFRHSLQTVTAAPHLTVDCATTASVHSRLKMLTLQKAFSQLRLVINAATVNASRCSQISTFACKVSPQAQLLPSKAAPQSVSRVCTLWYSTKPGPKKGENDAKVKSYDPPSPYRNPGPRRYGYEPHFFTGGK